MKNCFVGMVWLLCPVWVLAQGNSINGQLLTTSGDVRFLIVVASTESGCASLNCGKPEELFRVSDYFYASPSQFSPDAKDKTISNFFYQHTRHHPNRAPFRITGEVFPHTIVVPDRAMENGAAVMTKMLTDYPDFHYADFDKRTNETDYYSIDNSTTPPDKELDYVILVWAEGCTPGKKCGGYASLNCGRKKGANGYLVEDGFTMFGTGDSRSLFLHEFAHANFGCPHYCGGNYLAGDYFNLNFGWGLMNYGRIATCANAWESWYNGWIELKKTDRYTKQTRDLHSPAHNGTYILTDFVTTGDAMRLRVPNSDVNLWIEVHAMKSPFDDNDRSWAKNGLGEVPATLGPRPGVMMFLEKVARERTTLIHPLDRRLTNSALTLTRQGNIDFELMGYKADGRLWGESWGANRYPELRYTEEQISPTSHNTYCTYYAANYAYDTLFPRQIVMHNTSNNGGEYSHGCLSMFTNTSQEAFFVVDVNGKFDFYLHDISFQPGDKIGLSGKSMAHNMPVYNACETRIEPYYLNGISVEVLDMKTDGSAKIKVQFDDVTITKNQQFIGHVILPNLKEGHDLEIAPNYTMTIKRGLAPNRHTKAADSSFVNPTHFQLDSLASLKVGKGATLRVKGGSTLECAKGSRIEIAENATLEIQDSSTVQFKEGGTKQLVFKGPHSKFVYKGKVYGQVVPFE